MNGSQAAIGGWHCLAVDDQGRAYAWGMHIPLDFYLLIITLKIFKDTLIHSFSFCYGTYLGGNEYGQCGEEPSKDESGRPVRRDIVIPKRCAPKLTVRQVLFPRLPLCIYLWF